MPRCTRRVVISYPFSRVKFRLVADTSGGNPVINQGNLLNITNLHFQNSAPHITTFHGFLPPLWLHPVGMTDAPPQLGEISNSSEFKIPTLQSTNMNGNTSVQGSGSVQDFKDSVYNSRVGLKLPSYRRHPG